MPAKSKTYRIISHQPRRYAEPFWHVRWYENRNKRLKSLGIAVSADPDGREAEVEFQKWLAQKQADDGAAWRPGRPLAPSDLLIAQALNIYLQDHAVHQASALSEANFAVQIDQHFPGKTMADVTAPTCRRYVEIRRKAGVWVNKRVNGEVQRVRVRDVSPSTVARELDTLKAAGRHCVKEGYLQSAPAIVKPPRGDARPRWLTREEAHTLILHMQEPHVRLATRIALMTGQRISSILALHWMPSTVGGHVDLDAGVIRFLPEGATQTKKQKATQRIQRSLLPFLVLAKKRALGAHVVAYRGRPVKSVANGVRMAARRAGLEGVSPHVFKHTACTWLVQSGVPLSECASFLATNVTTIEKHYWHHSPHYQEGAANAL